MAVETRAFPLFDITDGIYQITVSEPNPRPLKDYIKRQERFARWKNKDIEALQEDINTTFHALEEKVNRSL
jgi:pyruvate/2-oxoacid:ferredoxin oxidoreductase beta subunit